MLIYGVWLRKGVFLCVDEAYRVKNITNEPGSVNSREQECSGQACVQRKAHRAWGIGIMSKEVGEDFECQAMSKRHPLSSYRNLSISLNVWIK